MKNLDSAITRQQIEKEIRQLEQEIDREYIRLGKGLTQMTETSVARINRMAEQVIAYRQCLNQQRYYS